MSTGIMRVLHINICLLLISVCIIRTQASSSLNPTVSFLDGTNPGGEHFLKLMKKHFSLSMDYLLTSKQFASQYAQRPGLAKYMNEASSRQWDEGMDVLKKFLQRGGSIKHGHFKSNFGVAGMPEMSYDESDQYIPAMRNMLEDSTDLTRKMNHLHHLAGRPMTGLEAGDAEIAHYFDSKLEKEAEIHRELAGKINTLEKMIDSGIAKHIFDSDL